MNKNYHFIALFAICLFSIAANSRITKDEILGSWKYKVTSVPPEYENGIMSFEQRDDKMLGFIGSTENKMPMRDLVIKEKMISFKLQIESSEIVVNLVQTGDKMSGNVITEDGKFPIVAEKQVTK